MEPEMIKIKINGVWYTATPLKKEQNQEPKTPTNPYVGKDVFYYLNNIASVLHTDVGTASGLLRLTGKICHAAPLSMLLYTIAIDLDKDYSDNIRSLSSVWVYNKADGKFVLVPTENFSKNAYKYIAMFRNKEDAVFAIKTANAIKKYLYAE